ncbi:hypothetical protein HRbin17_02608 [bacterium HR17]|jgi:nitrogenase molybdenum-iron protein alpha/beta subunit|uniref:Uncharacterized protein n=1 Tax=Candidatus Fervidibacter japonicus TaxID=2035412 RepID=A0A2H5XFY0_9BACT|nr:hypothetical protein HRbin17_02608 [bacterium HR17]
MSDKQGQLHRVRLRILECRRHLRNLEQRLAANPRDRFARREWERTRELLAKLEDTERQLSGQPAAIGGDSDAATPSESESAGGG